jgi:hypothetical protein
VILDESERDRVWKFRPRGLEGVEHTYQGTPFSACGTPSEVASYATECNAPDDVLNLG